MSLGPEGSGSGSGSHPSKTFQVQAPTWLFVWVFFRISAAIYSWFHPPPPRLSVAFTRLDFSEALKRKNKRKKVMPVPEGSFILPTQLISIKGKKDKLNSQNVSACVLRNNNYFYFPPTSVWFILTFIRTAIFFCRFFSWQFSPRLSFRLTSGFQSKLLLFSQKSVKEHSSRISLRNELTQEEFPVSQGSVSAGPTPCMSESGLGCFHHHTGPAARVCSSTMAAFTRKKLTLPQHICHCGTGQKPLVWSDLTHSSGHVTFLWLL